MKTSTLTVLLTLAAAAQGTETTSLGRTTLKPVARRFPLFGGFARLFGNNKVAVTDDNRSNEKETAASTYASAAAVPERPSTASTEQSSSFSERKTMQHRRHERQATDPLRLTNEELLTPRLDEIELVDEFADGRDAERFQLLHRVNMEMLQIGCGWISTTWAYHLAKTGALADICSDPVLLRNLNTLLRQRLEDINAYYKRFYDCGAKLLNCQDDLKLLKPAKNSILPDKLAEYADQVQNTKIKFQALRENLKYKKELLRQILPAYARILYVLNVMVQIYNNLQPTNQNGARQRR